MRVVIVPIDECRCLAETHLDNNVFDQLRYANKLAKKNIRWTALALQDLDTVLKMGVPGNWIRPPCTNGRGRQCYEAGKPSTPCIQRRRILMPVEIRHWRGLQRRSRNSKINGHISSKLYELVTTPLLPLARGLVPKGSYEQRLNELEGSLSSTNQLITEYVHCLPHELIMYFELGTLCLLRDRVHQHGKQ
ncbi:hypothetical protein SNOG_20003 [Parastagonospora nodorum SN15]|uniref:Uncharacterized protein n=1 Tax=Phaeosphaeria nodorum (strain SN15 / ATCC MYA-4574 / FGSC 10173) TaxID=321614 RepID=A9JTZ7_PHANO|nr:hypothetical protein SNOG_20003 [Parastagonospora nodorum SN15]EDP89753.1 hypothetical protein SNOG_20003 [Parastagonospora nodorum SN15]